MLQQSLAQIVIAFFIVRLIWQRKNGQVGGNEFVFWLVFWMLSMVIVSSLKWIDTLVADIGFSAPGIEVLLYAAVAVLFYFIFRLRIRLEKMERDLTKIVREIALKDGNDKD